MSLRIEKIKQESKWKFFTITICLHLQSQLRQRICRNTETWEIFSGEKNVSIEWIKMLVLSFPASLDTNIESQKSDADKSQVARCGDGASRLDKSWTRTSTVGIRF